MRCVFDQNDIKPGKIVSKVGCKEKWMIGYSQGANRKIFTLNSLSDGMVIPFNTKTELANHLSDGEMIPDCLVLGES